MADAAIAFGPFVLDPVRGTLHRGSAAVPLGQRTLAVLAALAETPGRTLSKDELIARAWPGAIVEEGNLTVQIAALRRALGETPDGQSWILTVPRVGYRLLSPAAPPATDPDPALPLLAVLPFQNLGGDPEQDWFADGVVEDMITALSRFHGFAVIARNSAFVYKGRSVDVRQIATDLGVRYVLEGSVRRAGDRLRITAQLVDGITGAHLWAEHFDGALSEVFAFQDRITEDVALLVDSRIQAAEIARSRVERPKSVAAYDIYLQAIPKLTVATATENAEAYALLTRALAIEPDNAILLSEAAWALGHRISMGWPQIGPDDRQACAAFARQGLQRANGDPLVMARCGMQLLQAGREYEVGMAVLETAARANPNHHWIVVLAGIAHLHCGDLDDALVLFHRAIRLSPNDMAAHVPLTGIAHAHMVRGDYTETLSWAVRSLAVNARFDPTYWMLVAASAHLGRMDEARRFLADFRALAPEATVASIRAGQPAHDPRRVEAILDGLRLAGLPEA
jgi:TolB-like protein